MTKISIAMATFNGERFIRQQLDSFAQQNLHPSELIVCDDGSTDSTLTIIDEFSRSAPFPVEVVRNPRRLGYTANFLKAAQICRGDLIAFSDQDDEWLPGKLGRIVKASHESEALLFAHSTEWIDKDGNLFGIRFPIDRRYRRFQSMSSFPAHAIVVRRSFLEMTRHSLSAENYQRVAGEIEFGVENLLLEVANAMNRVLFLPDVLMRWRVHSATNHAWTKLLEPPAQARVSLAARVFPPDLAEKYAEGGASFRAHAALLACVVADLAGVGAETEVPREQLMRLSNLESKRADVMDQRALFYRSQSRKARVGLMLKGAAMGQYRRARHGGVGIHNALRDIVAVLALK